MPSDNVFNKATGEWGSKRRKQESYKRRGAMKDDTVQQTKEATAEEPTARVVGAAYKTEAQKEISRLKQELKLARTAIKALRQALERSHKYWFQGIGRDWVRAGGSQADFEAALEKLKVDMAEQYKGVSEVIEGK